MILLDTDHINVLQNRESPECATLIRKMEASADQKLRIGTMDLKIASITLVRRSTLLSSNLRDFQCVPGLVVEDWLHSI